MRAATSKAPSILRTCFIVTAAATLMASCGGGGSSSEVIEQVTIKGLVVEGNAAGCLVCIDLNRNGRCDENESQARADAAGGYQLSIPKGSSAPLIAQMVDAKARAADSSKAADVSYRMASPSSVYSTNITPYTTLVHLTGETNFLLAEEMVRNVLGLPPKFNLDVDASTRADSLVQSVATAVVSALEAADASIDMASGKAIDRVVAALPPALTTVPQFRITTKNGAPIESKEIYVDATFTLTNPAASVQTFALNGKVRGRGNSTWNRPKNPYKVVFKEDAALANLPDVLGMKKIKNWVLLADYFDRSLIRNKLAYTLGNSSVFADGLKWNPSGQHVEVWLNGDYVGVYLLAEDIRIDPARLDIRKMSTASTAGEVDGGYIVEVDVRLDCYNGTDFSLQYVSAQGVPFCIDTPDETAITPAQLAYVKNLLNDVELDLYGPSRTDRINPASFADWYLIQELFRNNDALFYGSVFMWKDTATAANPSDRLLNMGPLWDFDLSAGNINYYDNWLVEGCWVSKPYIPNWIAQLLSNPQFLDLTIARWKQKRPALEKFINSSIDTYSMRLDAAQQRNFTRWPLFGEPLTNYYVFTNYADEVAFLKQYLNDRMVWLDKALASPASFTALCK